MVVQTQVALEPDERDLLLLTHELAPPVRLRRFNSPLQASLQQVIASQLRSHFLRHEKGRRQ